MVGTGTMIEYLILLSILIFVWFSAKWFFRVLVMVFIAKVIKKSVDEHKAEIERKKEEWRAKHGRGL
jgi:hypothetical protein